MVGQATERAISPVARKQFLVWTGFWWGGVGVMGALFFLGYIDFINSARISLYGVSIWLNGWLLGLMAQKNDSRSKLDVYHDCLVMWMLCYAMTNVIWEIPWVIFSPFVFEGIHTIEDAVSYTGFMRESVTHMWWWMLGSFGAVDLRTLNHNSTFYTIEVYAFANVASILYFFHLNKKRSPYRYLVPVLSCGAPAAATFVFSFSEVFGHFENMPGGVADTLLALAWTQYQYFVFPLIFGYWGYKLLMADWRQCQSGAGAVAAR